MMKRHMFFFLIGGLILSGMLSSREIIIEDFESGNVVLTSFPGQDLEPDNYAFVSDTTATAQSQYSLGLYGNTWKVATILPYQIAAGDVWQIDVYVPNVASIQGFGISDGTNHLFYSLFGSVMLNIEEWVPVYQGNFSLNAWHSIPLPVADDWFAWFDEYPVITQLIFVNDTDTNSGLVYFDNVFDITEDLPAAPQVEISYAIVGDRIDRNGLRNVTVQFESSVFDPDSDEFDYYWEFGDGETSNLEAPQHTYLVEDDHAYTVLLQVQDDTFLWGYAIGSVQVDAGETSFPLTMNFVGDISLARNMQTLINNVGVEAIFDPTLPWLGEAADITVANVENPFTTSTSPHPTKPIYFKSAPANAAGLAYAGIDVVTLANNHIWDYLHPGLLETQQTLDQLNILHSGAGANSYEAYLPLFVNRSGVNIAFLASSDRTGQYNNYQPYLQAGLDKSGFAYMTPYYVLKQIQTVEDVADLIVVNTHSGSEYSTGPGANYDFASVFAGWDERDFNEDEDYTPRLDIPHMWDIEIRHFFIDSGADIVICHHPHIIHGVEIYNGKLIAHSLGNFVFDLTYAETFPSMILNTKINENGFYNYQITPVYIDDFIPNYASGELGAHILDYVAMKSKELNTYLHVDRQQNFAEVIIDTLTMQESHISCLQEIDLFYANGYYSTPPVRLPRQGFISLIEQIEPYSAGYEFRVGRENLWFGNFEPEGSTGWNTNSDDEWIDDEDSYEGLYSLCLRRASNAPGNVLTNLENRLKKYSSGAFSIHGYIKTSNGQGVTIQARYYTNRTGGNYIGIENLGFISGDTDWNFYYKELTVPNNANFIDICCSSDPPAAGESFARFDNVGLIEWTEWEPLGAAQTPILSPNDYYYLQIRTSDQFAAVTVQYRETNYGNFLVPASQDLTTKISAAELKKNFPNPFNPTTTISFDLHIPAEVELSVYNIKGQKVRTLLKSQLAAGAWFADWNGKDTNGKPAASGVYFFRLSVNDKPVSAKKCLLLK